jgi:unsaturated chondroitin disaccharide hydrolase
MGPALSQRELFEQAFEFARLQLHNLIGDHPRSGMEQTFIAPIHTRVGRWVYEPDPWTSWCDGFLGGQLWLISQHFHDPWFHQKAIDHTRRLEDRQSDTSVHDLGFIFMPTYLKWAEEEPNEPQNQVLIKASRTLARRFQENGGYLCSFRGPESCYVDIMANINLVFYAAWQTEDQELLRIATRHCLTTRRYLVRGDFSTAHEGLFDPSTGQFLRQNTHQGWRSDSCWARGHAWAMLGFTEAYRYTRDDRFLQTAAGLADYYIEHTPPDGIPPNDWDEPQPKYPVESSAAAVAACALFDLAQENPQNSKSHFYTEYALTILQTLTTPQYLANETPGWEGILKHGIYHLPDNVGVDESVAWGDYFYLEALKRGLELVVKSANPLDYDKPS